MTQENEKRYDEVPYESHPYKLSHPSWLATVAATFGLSAPPAASARILELGCASGGNLVPMAETLPNSKCLGIDLSSRQIKDGQAFIESTGLSNVELRQTSITDVDDSYGEFDYIICHGVFSWVEPPIQQKILELCSNRLSPNGLAYISYNTYPGWHMKGMLRDMMRFHANRFKTPAAQIAQSRALLNVLAKTVPSQDNPFGMLLKNESEYLRRCSDWYIYHEHLELSNDPLYFHEFAQRAHDTGLQFLGEAELRTMLTEQMAPEVQASLKEVATGIIYAEQYMDFFRNRTFRQSILCRKGIELNRKLNADTFRNFSFASELKPKVDGTDVMRDEPVVFEAPNWPSVTISGAGGKATLLCLSEAWPEYVPIPELERRVRQRLGMPSIDAANTDDFVDTMGSWFTKGIAKITLDRPICVSKVSERPLAGTVARAQARAGKKTVTSLLHKIVKLSDFDVAVLSLLDGSLDQPGILDRLANGPMEKACAFSTPKTSAESLQVQVEQSLERLALVGLLRG